MKKLLQKIGQFFLSLFNSAARTWAKLSPDVQDAFVKGSEILALINKNVEAAPDFLIDLILERFPELDRESLLKGLQSVQDGLNIADDIVEDDLHATIINIQAFLADTHENNGQLWAKRSAFAAKVLAAFFAPNIKNAILELLMEYVYQNIVKK